jgi:hypothetical protein
MISSKQYIQKQEQAWFEEFSPFILPGETLKIGNGLGHLSEQIRQVAKELTIIDVQTFPHTVNKDAVLIYPGYPIPFADKAFQTSILVFTLHHIPSNKEFFKEIVRVTEKRIILVEETYDNIFQKLHLYFRDWKVNRTAGQFSKLHWNSYFRRKGIDNLAKDMGLKEAHRKTKKHKTYYKELVILDL